MCIVYKIKPLNIKHEYVSNVKVDWKYPLQYNKSKRNHNFEILNFYH